MDGEASTGKNVAKVIEPRWDQVPDHELRHSKDNFNTKAREHRDAGMQEDTAWKIKQLF